MTRRTRYGVLFLLMAVAMLAAAAGARAAAPTAITGSVTAVGATTATVTGTVNPGGVATTWYVEYGTSTSYGSQTASTNAGSGTGNIASLRVARGPRPGHHVPLPRRRDIVLPARAAAVTACSQRWPRPASSPARRRRSASRRRPCTGRSTRTARRRPGRSSTGRARATARRRRRRAPAAATTRRTSRIQITGLQKGQTFHYRLRRLEQRRHDARR